MKILIADDSPANRLILKEILEVGGFELAGELSDGNHVIEEFERLKPDILLLDLAMPKKDGLSIIKELIPKKPDAKIIVISATGDSKIADECLKAGAIQYINKPYDFKDILVSINQAFEKKPSSV